MNSSVLKRIAKEIEQLQKCPPEGVKIILNEGDLSDIQAFIQGPAGTPYHKGTFHIKIVLGSNYPSGPPSGFFTTKIFHPNVAPTSGEICVSTLKKDWKSDVTLTQLLITIKCLLIVPNPESALNEEAGKLLLEDYEAYCKTATLYTSIHASKHKVEFAQDKPSSGILTPAKGNVSPQKRSGEESIAAPLKKSSKDKKSLKRL